jgi:hypothetical protein
MTATLDGDGTLTVRTTRAGGEAMPDFESQAPWFNTDVAPLITSAVIEEGVTGLGFYAFFGCFNLTSAALPSSLTRIGLYAFYGCSKLETVFIPASVTTIETVSFSFCSALTAIEVDAANPAYLSDGGVLYSKDRTLLHTCPGGKGGTFTVPSTVRVLGDAAFYGCEKLTAVEIHNAVTTIGSSAFGYCEMPVVNIPASVTSIGHDAFRGRVTRGVTAINVDAANTAYTSEDGVLYNKDKTLLICYPAGKAATSFDIPATVTTIRGAAFCFATFTSVTIPSSVETVEGYAFEYCTNLRDVTVQWDEPLSVDNHTFHAVDLPAATLHVSYGTKALYEAAPVWKDFGSIEEEEEEEEEEEGDDTGSEAVAPASLRVYALAGSLHISSATSCTVHIYTPAGRLVKQLYLPAGETASAALPGGLYIVRAGGETRKAAVR